MPLLEHLVERVKKSKKLNKVVIATSKNLEDDITSLKSFAISLINILENLIGMTQSYGILTKKLWETVFFL